MISPDALLIFLLKTRKRMAPNPESPGNGPFVVGDRVERTGPPRTFHNEQTEVVAGDTGTVVHDFGWDYRYLIKLDRPVGPPIRHGNGIEFHIRSSGSNWKKIS